MREGEREGAFLRSRTHGSPVRAPPVCTAAIWKIICHAEGGKGGGRGRRGAGVRGCRLSGGGTHTGRSSVCTLCPFSACAYTPRDGFVQGWTVLPGGWFCSTRARGQTRSFRVGPATILFGQFDERCNSFRTSLLFPSPLCKLSKFFCNKVRRAVCRCVDRICKLYRSLVFQLISGL